MANQKSELIANAIDAYEKSELRRNDLAEEKEAAAAIARFLQVLGIQADVTSSVFEIDRIRFYSRPFKFEDDLLGYFVDASRSCPDCHERLVIRVTEFSKSITPAVFGQWLSRPHLCEFKEKDREGAIGFKAAGA